MAWVPSTARQWHLTSQVGWWYLGCRLHSQSIKYFSKRPYRVYRCQRLSEHAYQGLGFWRLVPVSWGQGEGHKLQSWRLAIILMGPCVEDDKLFWKEFEQSNQNPAEGRPAGSLAVSCLQVWVSPRRIFQEQNNPCHRGSRWGTTQRRWPCCSGASHRNPEEIRWESVSTLWGCNFCHRYDNLDCMTHLRKVSHSLPGTRPSVLLTATLWAMVTKR